MVSNVMGGIAKFSMQKKHGFTLIELMVAIAILGILAMVAAPSMLELFDKRRLTNAASKIVSLATQARTQSIMLNRPVSLVLTYSSTSEWCMGLTDRESCDCSDNTLTATDEDACSIDMAPSVSGEVSDRQLYILSSNELPGATMALHNETTPATLKLDYEPTRGIRSDTLGVKTFALSSTLGQRELRVALLLTGRSSMCAVGETLAGGIPPC